MRWHKRDKAESVKDVVLRNTGLSETEFLHPKQNPYIENLEQAVACIKDAMAQNLRISIMGDYDADGITSASILYRMLHDEAHYRNISMRFPKRFSEGYGLSMKVIDEIKDGLLITVDNGITAVKEIEKAKAKGIKVVVIDHHLPDPEKGLPAADAVVDPNALCESEFKGYCGAGLAYKVAEKSGLCSEKLLKKLLALAAIGTIADVMSLTGDNRNIVIRGLQAINDGNVPKGLDALLEQLGLYDINETDIGFKIGPILNASGRLYDNGAKYPFLLLGTDNYNPKLPEKLIEVNEKRKELVKSGMEAADRIVAEQCLYGNFPLVIYGEKSFHEGVVGIIAGKLAEKFHTPVIVLGDSDDEGKLKGSGRSYGDFNLKVLLDKVSDLMIAYGGHPGAAGLSVEKGKLAALSEALQQEAQKMGGVSEQTEMFYDLEINATETAKVIEELNKYAPYGEGNPKVVFKIKDYRLTPRNGRFFQTMGDGSVLKLFGDNNSAIGFDLVMQYEDIGQPTKMDLYGNISINKFNHRDEIQIEMCDFERAAEGTGTSLADMLSQRMKAFG